MSATIRIMLTTLLLAGGVAGCTAGDDDASIAVDFPSDPGSPQSEVAETTTVQQGVESSDSSVMGEITQVDAVQGTFTLEDSAGVAWNFRFSPETAVTGISPAQGLTGQTGSRVIVHYENDGSDSHRALLVEVVSE